MNETRILIVIGRRYVRESPIRSVMQHFTYILLFTHDLHIYFKWTLTLFVSKVFKVLISFANSWLTNLVGSSRNLFVVQAIGFQLVKFCLNQKHMIGNKEADTDGLTWEMSWVLLRLGTQQQKHAKYFYLKNASAVNSIKWFRLRS